MMIRFSKMRPGLLVCSGLRAVAPQRHAQVDPAVVAERRDRLAGLRVDRGQEAGVEIEQPAIRAVRRSPSS